MSMKRYYTFPKASGLESDHPIKFIFLISKTLVGSGFFRPLQWCILHGSILSLLIECVARSEL